MIFTGVVSPAAARSALARSAGAPVGEGPPDGVPVLFVLGGVLAETGVDAAGADAVGLVDALELADTVELADAVGPGVPLVVPLVVVPAGAAADAGTAMAGGMRLAEATAAEVPPSAAT